jgi:DNA-binding NarL/FixJ family response regulator
VSEAAELRGRYPIRILIVDDQKVVREGLVALVGLLPGITVVGAAADGEDAVRQALDLRPDVVLMDLNLPRSNGVEATERLRDLQPDTDAALFVSEATVKTHVNHIFGKTRLHDRAKLVSYAFRNGLAGPG